MPLYEYVCTNCGPFAAMRPLAEFASPCGCPECGVAAPRNLLASPALGGAAAPGAAPAMAKSHPGACVCCKPARGLRAEAVG
jgi:putative FmdB family regulatory protein